MAEDTATIGSVRAAIAEIVRVSADDLVGGVGHIIVATSHEMEGFIAPPTESAAFRSWFEGSVIVEQDGSPMRMYHGSYRDFAAFDRLASTAWRSSSVDTVGSWFSSEPGETGAGMYAVGDGATIYPVYLSVKRPRYFESFSELLDAMHEVEGRDPSLQSTRGLGSAEGLRAQLKLQGYDGISLAKTDVAALHKEWEELQLAVRRARDDEFSAPRTERIVYTAKRERLEEAARRVGAELSLYGGSTEFDGQFVVIPFDPEQIKSVWNQGTYDPANPDIRLSLRGDASARAFEAWFGDSKVVNEAGKPLVVYHGTGADFSEFDLGTFGKTDGGWAGRGLYFTPDASEASVYAKNGGIKPGSDRSPNVMPVLLSIRNPLEWELGTPRSREIQQELSTRGADGFRAWLIGRGYDGVHLTSRLGENQWVACRPEQVKSAIGNTGAYDPNNPDIRYSLAGLDPRAQAWHDAGTHTTVLLADRIPAGREGAVFLHEVVHRNGRQALPEGQWDALVGQVKAWADAGLESPERAIHDAAAARVATAGVAGARADEELFAYAVEEAVARGIEPTAAAVDGSAQAWLQAVVESIQRISDKLLGNSLQDLAGQDLVDLAYALAQLDSPEHGVEVRRALDERLMAARPMATSEQSQAYAEAVQAGQRRQALRVLHAAAGVQLVDHSYDRSGAHDAPDPAYGAPMWDVSRGIYPEDLYQGRMREYGTSSNLDADAFASIWHADGRPNAFVTVYRAVEKSGPSQIKPGDWVTPSRGYAKEHGQDNISGSSKILSKMVCARDLFTDGNSILEWGYHPQPFMPEFPKSEAGKARTLQERLDILAERVPPPVVMPVDEDCSPAGP